MAVLYEQEYKRVRHCHKKISRLMYGKNGLIAFMCNLFAFIEEREMQQVVNYYFAIKEQVEAMDYYESVLRKESKHKHATHQISEESNEEEEEKCGPKSLGMDFGPNSEPRLRDEPHSSSYSKQNPSTSSNHQSAHSQSPLRSEREWFTVSEWYGADNTGCQRLRRTQ